MIKIPIYILFKVLCLWLVFTASTPIVFYFFLSQSYFFLSRSVVSVVFLGVLCILTNIVIKHCGRLESISNNAMNVLYNSNAINKYSSTLPIVTRIGGYEICPFTRLFFHPLLLALNLNESNVCVHRKKSLVSFISAVNLCDKLFLMS